MKSTRGLVVPALALGFPFVLGGHATAQPCVQAPAGLVSWWPGDGHPDDISGANHGTLQGGATFATGKVAEAFSLDGVDDHVRVSHNDTLNLAVFTIDAWLRPLAYSVSSIVQEGGLGGTEDDFHNNYRLATNADGRVWGRIGNAAGAWTIESTDPLALGQWQHVAFTYDGSFLRLYIDGLGAATPVEANITPYFSPSDLIIGRYDWRGTPFGHFNGLIDEVEIYSRALTDSEILAIFDEGDAGKCKVTTVAIDIKPGSFPNSINLDSAGVVPVAILSSATFDATETDPATVTLAGAAVRLIGKGDRFACGGQDVNEDGLLDLVCHVATAQFLIEPGDSVAVLEAKTINGHAIRGEDFISIVR